MAKKTLRSVMTKKSKAMETIDQRLDQQDQLLNEILLCLKGSESMNIEGVIPAQKRIEQKIDREINSLHEWKDGIQKYFDVLSSRGFKRFMWIVVFLFVGMFLYLKLGAAALMKFITWLLS